jgi:hypothetical protein
MKMTNHTNPNKNSQPTMTINDCDSVAHKISVEHTSTPEKSSGESSTNLQDDDREGKIGSGGKKRKLTSKVWNNFERAVDGK